MKKEKGDEWYLNLMRGQLSRYRSGQLCLRDLAYVLELGAEGLANRPDELNLGVSGVLQIADALQHSPRLNEDPATTTQTHPGLDEALRRVAQLIDAELIAFESSE